MRTKVKQIIFDIIKVIKIATITFLCILVIIGGISLIVYKGKFVPSLDIVRAVLFFGAGIGLIITAALVLKRNTDDAIEKRPEWQNKFKSISFRTFIATFSVTIIIYGCIIDYIRYALK
ncbi:hypothetical protein [Inconstantimicrobium mannanitabidum]|uniref:Uncharacterized protein n=1 Tax=Inconstantimicrobium mannanitabidum TaxID=1604901 RepID=A0ACB5RE91_9CLOT|nr:hypothetical protein [Clostridium sp. TW13]GKX67081.1 hypothetical protein rsdtw13_23390 [Clostridium sp. TW13]